MEFSCAKINPGNENMPLIGNVRFCRAIDKKDELLGEPYECKGCKAALSLMSVITDPDRASGKRTWICEYCGHDNKLLIAIEDIADCENGAVYMLERPEDDDTIFDTAITLYDVFCMDISGSMSQAVRITDRALIRLIDELRSKINEFRSEDTRIIPQSNERYISRIEAVQITLMQHIKTLFEKSPQKRIGILTFNNEVTIIGDGKMDPIVIKGDDLKNENKIKEIVDKTPVFDTVSRTKNILLDKVLRFEENGATSLGAALLCSIKIAARKNGGKVILCTDGLSNEGIGSLTNPITKEAIDFYENLAQLAQVNGVSVSIIAIDGEDCNLAVLRPIVDRTRGYMKLIDISRLNEIFPSIVNSEPIAIDVEIKLIVPDQFYIKDYSNPDNESSQFERKIGNVFNSTEVSFEFGLKKNTHIDVNQVKKLIFQTQIKFTTPDNGRYLRIYTKEILTTDQASEVSTTMNRKIIGKHLLVSMAEQIEKSINSDYLNRLSMNLTKYNANDVDTFDKEGFIRKREQLSRYKEIKTASGRPGGANIDDKTAEEFQKIKSICTNDLDVNFRIN